jgi:hypothetical protein
MTKQQAIRQWFELCNNQHGVDSNGDQVSSLTDLGKIANSHGLPTWYSEAYADPAKIAVYLHLWADAIDDGGK